MPIHDHLVILWCRSNRKCFLNIRYSLQSNLAWESWSVGWEERAEITDDLLFVKGLACQVPQPFFQTMPWVMMMLMACVLLLKHQPRLQWNHICCGERYLRRQNPKKIESKSVVSDSTCSGLGRQQFWPQFRIFTFVTTKVLSRLLFRWKWIKSESLVSAHHGQ